MFICTTHLQSKIISESSINRGAESVFRQRSQMYVEAGGAPCEPGAGGRLDTVWQGEHDRLGPPAHHSTDRRFMELAGRIWRIIDIDYLDRIQRMKDPKTGANQSSFLLPDQTGNGFPTFF
jgi:hypothetical protein